MGEEGKLLAHQRAVDAVLAGDLGEQAAQLGGALAGGLGGAGGDERAEALERDLGGGDAERGAGALQQRGAVLLEGAAAAHLGLHVGEPGEHDVDVARADRLALVEDEREQAAGGVDLRVQVDEQLGFENRAHDGVLLAATGRAGRRGRCRRRRSRPLVKASCIGAAYGPSVSVLSLGSISPTSWSSRICSKPSAAL